MNNSNPRKRPSCTTNRIHVGQDRGAKLLRSRTTPIVYTERVSAIGFLRKRRSCTTNGICVGQDWETKLLRSGETPIVYTERVSAIELLRKRLSCAIFFPFVVQDKGGDYAA